MSYEAWGEPEESPLEAAIEAGWIDPADLTRALIDVMNERDRHHNVEGWTPEHDDEHTGGELALAAGAYCESAARPKLLGKKPGAAFAVPKLWPRSWTFDWWKPKSPRADLVRAGALILAEIERLDRAVAREHRFLLDWLNKGEFSSYGECNGPSLDALVQSGLAQVLPLPASGPTDPNYRRVRLTDAGHTALAIVKREAPAP